MKPALAKPIAMTRFLTRTMSRHWRGIGVAEAIVQVAACVRQDFFRWADFEKSARLATIRASA
jgi:ornithine cyclodeaminase